MISNVSYNSCRLIETNLAESAKDSLYMGTCAYIVWIYSMTGYRGYSLRRRSNSTIFEWSSVDQQVAHDFVSGFATDRPTDQLAGWSAAVPSRGVPCCPVSARSSAARSSGYPMRSTAKILIGCPILLYIPTATSLLAHYLF